MVEDFIKIDAENREEILNFIFSFSGKISPSPVWDYLFPDSPFKGDYICIGLERYCRGIIEEKRYWGIGISLQIKMTFLWNKWSFQTITLKIIINLWDTEIFNYLDCSFDEFKISVELESINDTMIQTIRDLGRILICDIVNEYITSPSLCINEKGDFVMEIGDKYLLNIIFDELVVLCQFYEIRKCKFRKCHKYFIAKKEKKKLLLSRLCR